MSDLVDTVLESLVAPSFTTMGYRVRRRLESWRPLDDYDLTGRVIAITGPTSGLGLAATEQLSRCGASLVLIARNAEKVQALADRLPGPAEILVADLGELDAVRRAGEALAALERLDVLIHNAGALFNERRMASSGIELTVAVQVVAPFLLTGMALERLRSTPGSRVLTMSSGGMYATGLTVSRLQMEAEGYQGAEQYARAKRAQVTLNEQWAAAVPEVLFHALHPGWADTPGVEEALPVFRRVVGRLLRSSEEGADTLVWLAADDEPTRSNGDFWHDRRRRSIHRLASTTRSDTAERREALWAWVSQAAGWDLA